MYPHNNKLPDIFTFQEMHSTPVNSCSWPSLFNKSDKNLLLVHGSGRSRGILLRFNETLPFNIVLSVTDPEGRYIVAHVKLRKESFTVVSVYLDPLMSLLDRSQSMARIMEEVAKSGNARVLFCGDFNAVLEPALDYSTGVCHSLANSKHAQLVEFANLHDLTDVWRTLLPTDRRFTSFGSGIPTRIDLAFAMSPMLTHIESSHIGTSFGSDHAALFVDFNLDQDTWGKGCWHLPQYVLSDPIYVRRIENVIESVLQENGQLDANQRWDFLQVAVWLETIKFVAAKHKAKQEWVKQLDENIALITQARDKVHNDRHVVHYYSEKLKVMQLEREDMVKFHTEKALWYNTARKHHESNRSTRYYFQLPGCKYDAIKQLHSEDGKVVNSSKKILHECQSFYTKLYQQVPHPEAQNKDLQWKFLRNIPPVMSVDKAVLLDKEITTNELFTAYPR